MKMKRRKRVTLEELQQLYDRQEDETEVVELAQPLIQNEPTETEATMSEIADMQGATEEAIVALRAGREAVLEEFRQHAPSVPDDHPGNLVRAGRQEVSAIHAGLLKAAKGRPSSSPSPSTETLSEVAKGLQALNENLSRTLDEIVAEVEHTEPRLLVIRLRTALQDYLWSAVQIYKMPSQIWRKEG
jgi:hypothetical protein